MERLNVAELLRNCPKGMKLDCTIYEDVVFHDIVDRHYPIRVRRKKGGLINLNAYGCMDDKIDSKCVIFPKGKTTWEGFQGPFKKGDIVVNNSSKRPFIYKGKNKDYYECYVGLTVGFNLVKECSTWIDISRELRPATEEEKQKLFQAIKDNGYKWDDETLTLWRIPRFKKGDRIRPKYKKTPDTYTIRAIEGDSYCCGLEFIWIADQDDYELVSDTDGIDTTTLKPLESKVLFPNTDRFDITTLKPFESKVLVWEDQCKKWIPAFWGSKCDSGGYITTYGWCKYCIPYEGNEHLTGTSKDCDKFYKTWN